MPVGAQFLVIVQMHGLEHPVIIDVLVAALLDTLAHKVKQQFVNFGRYAQDGMILSVIILDGLDKTLVIAFKRIPHGLTLGREIVLSKINHCDVRLLLARLPFGLTGIVKRAAVTVGHIPAGILVTVIVIAAYSHPGVRHRYEIGIEDYERRILIEGEVALDIARSMVRPVVADEFSKLATAIGQAKKDGLKVGLRGLMALSLKLGAGLDDLHVKCERVEKSLAKRSPSLVIAAMNDLRRTVDRLEHLVDDSRWPLPKYREMLFVY